MIKGKKKKKLYKDNVKKHGERFQFRKLQEEVNELGAAINHFLTGRGKGVESIHEEFADVEILMEQLRPHLDNQKIKDWKTFKLKRLKRRLKS